MLSITSHTRATRAYHLLSSIFIACLVMTNVIAGKYFTFRGAPLSCSIVAYPITFLITDIISEVYGLAHASLLVRHGFLVSILMTLLIGIAGRLPIAPLSPISEPAFQQVFGLLPGVVLGSMLAYLVAQLVDVHVFEYLKKRTRGRYLWLRNNVSTLLSQWVDTVLVVTIALVIWPQLDGNPHTQAIGWSLWWDIVLGQYLFKGVMALLDTPFVYMGVYWLKKWMKIS